MQNTNQKKTKVNFFWFRRDLRLKDNRGLSECLSAGLPVVPLFIFDTNILDKLSNKEDLRVNFIWQSLQNLKKELSELQSDIIIENGKPKDIFLKLIKKFQVINVYTNHDYEPAAISRDNEVKELLSKNGIHFLTFKDQCIFEKNEVSKKDQSPYTVFTPYKKRWLEQLNTNHLKPYAVKENFLNFKSESIKNLNSIGFKEIDFKFPKKTVPVALLKSYDKKRDFPYENTTSLLGPHLRFGTISIRKCVQIALELNQIWLSELIWRDFFMQILWHFPEVVDHSFRRQYDQIKWLNNESDFKLWCQGKTGYPLVDAAMIQLNKTGYMHNRVRMVTASFLTKHLLIDWRWGEKYFAEKLLDYDLSANNGNWQWAAGTGCDAAPYFRIFNPTSQLLKFDPNYRYIKKWIPQFDIGKYKKPIIDHDFARKRALITYRKGINL